MSSLKCICNHSIWIAKGKFCAYCEILANSIWIWAMLHSLFRKKILHSFWSEGFFIYLFTFVEITSFSEKELLHNYSVKIFFVFRDHLLFWVQWSSFRILGSILQFFCNVLPAFEQGLAGFRQICLKLLQIWASLRKCLAKFALLKTS